MKAIELRRKLKKFVEVKNKQICKCIRNTETHLFLVPHVAEIVTSGLPTDSPCAMMRPTADGDDTTSDMYRNVLLTAIWMCREHSGCWRKHIYHQASEVMGRKGGIRKIVLGTFYCFGLQVSYSHCHSFQGVDVTPPYYSGCAVAFYGMLACWLVICNWLLDWWLACLTDWWLIDCPIAWLLTLLIVMLAYFIDCQYLLACLLHRLSLLAYFIDCHYLLTSLIAIACLLHWLSLLACLLHCILAWLITLSIGDCLLTSLIGDWSIAQSLDCWPNWLWLIDCFFDYIIDWWLGLLACLIDWWLIDCPIAWLLTVLYWLWLVACLLDWLVINRLPNRLIAYCTLLIVIGCLLAWLIGDWSIAQSLDCLLYSTDCDWLLACLIDNWLVDQSMEPSLTASQ